MLYVPRNVLGKTVNEKLLSSVTNQRVLFFFHMTNTSHAKRLHNIRLREAIYKRAFCSVTGWKIDATVQENSSGNRRRIKRNSINEIKTTDPRSCKSELTLLSCCRPLFNFDQKAWTIRTIRISGLRFIGDVFLIYFRFDYVFFFFARRV